MRSLKLILLLIVIVIAFLIIFPSSLSAELSKSNFDMIRVAFMNGYLSAIQADMDTIKTLKKDRVKLKKYSQLAVDRYMDKVCALNQEGKVTSNKENKTVSHSNSTPL